MSTNIWENIPKYCGSNLNSSYLIDLDKTRELYKIYEHEN